MSQHTNAEYNIMMQLTCYISGVYADPKELKRQRARERYSQNREEINKRRREAYQQKKAITTENNGAQTPMDVSLGKDDQLLHIITFLLPY
jgi:hypothetical protein